MVRSVKDDMQRDLMMGIQHTFSFNKGIYFFKRCISKMHKNRLQNMML